MKPLKSGDFSLDVELLTGMEHAFRSVIDGARWENAWYAEKHVWSDHGNSENSVIMT